MSSVCFKEAEEYYIFAVRKSIVDYILLDPMEQQRLGIKVSPKVSCFVWFVLFVSDILMYSGYSA